MNGIKISLPGSNVENEDSIAFRSDRNTMKLDIKAEPVRTGFFKYTFPNNPPPTTLIGSVDYPIFEVQHNLGFLPAHLLYFYSYDFTGSYVVPNSYQLGTMFLTGAGNVSQYFQYYLDTFKLSIYYTVSIAVDHTATAFDVTGKSFGFKYMIYSNQSESDT